MSPPIGGESRGRLAPPAGRRMRGNSEGRPERVDVPAAQFPELVGRCRKAAPISIRGVGPVQHARNVGVHCVPPCVGVVCLVSGRTLDRPVGFCSGTRTELGQQRLLPSRTRNSIMSRDESSPGDLNRDRALDASSDAVPIGSQPETNPYALRASSRQITRRNRPGRPRCLRSVESGPVWSSRP